MPIHGPLKQWKRSPMDLQLRVRWEAYAKAKEDMLERTHIAEAPWRVVEANDKKRARNPDYNREPIAAEMDVPRKY